jgi:hypothetical protein
VNDADGLKRDAVSAGEVVYDALPCLDHPFDAARERLVGDRNHVFILSITFINFI